MSQMILTNLSAERAIHKQSALKIGEGDASMKITNDQLLHQSAFDGEGLALKKFTVFDKYIFACFRVTTVTVWSIGAD